MRYANPTPAVIPAGAFDPPPAPVDGDGLRPWLDAVLDITHPDPADRRQLTVDAGTFGRWWAADYRMWHLVKSRRFTQRGFKTVIRDDRIPDWEIAHQRHADLVQVLTAAAVAAQTVAVITEHGRHDYGESEPMRMWDGDGNPVRNHHLDLAVGMGPSSALWSWSAASQTPVDGVQAQKEQRRDLDEIVAPALTTARAMHTLIATLADSDRAVYPMTDVEVVEAWWQSPQPQTDPVSKWRIQ